MPPEPPYVVAGLDDIPRGYVRGPRVAALRPVRHHLGIRACGHPRRLRYSRERALELLHGRFASSFALLDDAEYAAGVARAERELPADGVDTTLRLALVTAHHPK